MTNLMHVSKKLSAFIHEELDEKAARSVEAHLRKCDKCWAAYKEILHGAEMAGQVRPLQPPDDLWQEIEKGIKALNSTVSKKAFIPEKVTSAWVPRFAGAMAVVLVLIISWWSVDRGILKMSPEVALSNYLEYIEKSSESKAISLAAEIFREFRNADRQRAFEAAGVAHVGDKLPLAGVPLTAQLVQSVDNKDVAQLVYANEETAFSVFIAPASMAFSFGDRQINDWQMEEIPCRKVASSNTATFWFGAGGFHCVLVSQLKDEGKNAAIIRYFVTAHNLL